MKNKDKLIKVGVKIRLYKVYKKVNVSVGAGSITLPKDLVGKIVYVEYKLKEVVTKDGN